MRASLFVLAGLGAGVVSIFVAAGVAVDQTPTAPLSPRLAKLPRNVLSSANLRENSLVLNGTPLENLSLGALTGTALRNEPSIGPALFFDAYTQKFMQYIIECALPETATVTASDGITTLEFYGAIGLAPEWENGPCLDACQEWVSACMLARTNVFGVAVQLYLDGPSPAFENSGGDPAGYELIEGAFYGNLFIEPPLEYSCRGPANEPLYQSFRVCARPGHRCGIQHVGPCSEIDGETGLPAKRRACTETDSRGNYIRCGNRMTIEGTNEFPETNREFTRIITSRLLPTTFTDGLRAGDCANPPPDNGPPDSGVAPASGSTAGSRCLSDEDCNSSILVCDVRFPNYTCTGACNNSSRVDYEEADCDGAGSTCLDLGGARFCTHACTSGQDPGEEGACQPGRVCYNGWLHRATPDRPGCYTFCSQDADCNNSAPCNERVGACGEQVDLSLIGDGLPCPLDQISCRGLCFALTDTSTMGVCGSVINTTVTDECPDEPEVIKPFSGGGDDFGICAFRNCRNDGDCQAPLRCLNGPMGSPVCTMY